MRTIAWTGESVQLPMLPAGFALTSGSPDALTNFPVTWSVAGNTAGPHIELRRYLTTSPASQFVSIAGTPVTIHGGSGLVAGNPAAVANAGLSEIVVWHETSSVVLSLTGYGIGAAELTDAATALVYAPGGPGPLVAGTPGAPVECRALPDGAQPRSAMVAKESLAYELAPPVAKLVLLTDLAAVDPSLVDCTFHPCPPGLLVWIVVTPVPYEPDGPAGFPVVPAGTTGYELVVFDAHTGVTMGTGEMGQGLVPGYWPSLVDFAP